MLSCPPLTPIDPLPKQYSLFHCHTFSFLLYFGDPLSLIRCEALFTAT